MNCKQGDLAIVVGGAAVGYIVQCVCRYDGPWTDATGYTPGWRVDRPIPKTNGSRQPFVSDDNLRPIRDLGDDATDETLTWLDVPTKQGETA